NRTQTEPPPLAADGGCHDGSVVITLVLRRFDCGGGSVDGGVEAVVAVAARGVVGRIDRETRSLFGVRQKNLAEKISGGGDWPAVVVAAGDCWGEGE
nr:hypothetical protein [Tanacetum cinerariifolium]